jgi:hypothetical protein
MNPKIYCSYEQMENIKDTLFYLFYDKSITIDFFIDFKVPVEYIEIKGNIEL